MQGSANGGACPFGGNGATIAGNEGLWENLHLFRMYDSPDETDIVTFHYVPNCLVVDTAIGFRDVVHGPNAHSGRELISWRMLIFM